jgi:hypothetical protein
VLPELAAASARRRASQPVVQPVLACCAAPARVSVTALALDDLHFADDASVELLQALLPRPHPVAASPALVPGPAPRQRAARQQALLDALATAGPLVRWCCSRWTKRRWPSWSSRSALPGVSGARTAPLLHQRSGGNPLFALETLKLAWSEGSITLADGLPRPQSLAS